MTDHKDVPQAEETAATENAETRTKMVQPIIVELGKQKSKKLKELKKGEGPLWEDVFDIIDEVQETLGEDLDGQVVVPIVMIYEKKRKRQSLDKILFPLKR